MQFRTQEVAIIRTTLECALYLKYKMVSPYIDHMHISHLESSNSPICLPQISICRPILEKCLTILAEGEVRVLWDRRLFLAMAVIGFFSMIIVLTIGNVYPFFSVVVCFY
jgi:hypothetical protein